MFTKTISTASLSRGLRPSKRTPRNSDFLTTCGGMVGRDGVLQVIDEITKISSIEITDGFPYPQIFVEPNYIVVCGLTDIYEYSFGSLNHQLTVAAGGRWSLVSFSEFAYLSNGVVSVTRSAENQQFSLSTLLTANAICNFNGQVLIGAPNSGHL